MPKTLRTAVEAGPHRRPLPATRVHRPRTEHPVVLQAVVTEAAAVPDGPVDPFTLWIGALATALVGGLVSIVGVITTRAVPGVDLISPHGGTYVPTVAWHLTAGTVLAVLVAASLAHLLLLLSPRPLLFFRCVALLVTATVALWPFTTDADTDSRIISAVVYLAIGLSVTGLLTTVSRHCSEPAGVRPYGR